jgi:GNAT superfamily N-acetyltransferase
MDPDEPIDPDQLRHWWQEKDPTFPHQRWMALDGSAAVASIDISWTIWEKDPDRNSQLVIALPAARLAAYGDDVYAYAEARARGTGGRAFWGYAREFVETESSFLVSRGYAEVSRQRWWELDLTANAGLLRAMAERSRSRMRGQDIRILALADDDDPERYQKLYALNSEAQADEPSDVPRVSGSYELFESWLAMPGTSQDRTWIARRGDEMVGISRLRYPSRRGNVWTRWTGTARSARGQGVARALKLETLLQAIDLGVSKVRTSNDHRNAPILHLNQELGYKPIAGVIRFRKISD